MLINKSNPKFLLRPVQDEPRCVLPLHTSPEGSYEKEICHKILSVEVFRWGLAILLKCFPGVKLPK